MPSRCRTFLLLLATLLVCRSESCQAEVQAQPPVTEIAAVRQLQQQGALIRVQGVITRITPWTFYAQDSSSAIMVQYRDSQMRLKTGDDVIVTGDLIVAAAGNQVRAGHVAIIRARPLPKPELLTTDQMRKGGCHGQLAQAVGTVLDVAVTGSKVMLYVQTVSGHFAVEWPVASLPTVIKRPDELVDALVEATGIALPMTPFKEGMPSGRLELESEADVRVLKPGSTNVFSRPQATIATLLGTQPSFYAERVRVTGTVTCVSAAGWFYLQDGTGAVRASRSDLIHLPNGQRRHTQSDARPKRGDLLEVVGYATHSTVKDKVIAALSQCEWRRLGTAIPPPYEPVKLATTARPEFDGRSVSLIGRVLEVQEHRDWRGALSHQIAIEDGQSSFWAVIDGEQPARIPWKIGELVRVNGVVMAAPETPMGAPESIRLQINELADIQAASELWRPEFLVRWFLVGSGLAVGAVVWILLLRRQVLLQTAQLRESNIQLARFKAVVENTSDLVAMTDLDANTTYMNPSGFQLLGYPLDNNVRDFSIKNVYPGHVYQLFEREGFEHALEHGHWSAQITMRHADGHEVPVSFVGIIVRGTDGKPEYMACIARDHTDQDRLEKQLRESLEHERELNELKSSFVNTISHEFRTPLGIILFAASMLRRFDGRYGPEERSEQLAGIEEAVGRMNQLVEQSLNLGRAEAAEPQAGNMDLHVLCRRIVDEVQSSSSLRCPVSLEMTEAPERVRSDSNLLRAILGNLLGNAVKYSPAGSPVTLKVEKRDGRLIFTVRDHGPGLRPEDMPNLFMTFYRGSQTAGIPGTGLGLAIVRRCAEALGGEATARNADGTGAEFVVSVPCLQVS